MSWLDNSVNENKGIEMIGGIEKSWYEKELQKKEDSIIESHKQLCNLFSGVLMEEDYDYIKNPFGEVSEEEQLRVTNLKGTVEFRKSLWDQLTKIHEPLKDKDGNSIGRMIIMGTGGEIEEQDSFEELFNKPDSYNFIHFKRQ